MQVTMLDHSGTAYTVGQLQIDVNNQLSAEGYSLSPGSHLTLESMQADEGLPHKATATKVRCDLWACIALHSHALRRCESCTIRDVIMFCRRCSPMPKKM